MDDIFIIFLNSLILKYYIPKQSYFQELLTVSYYIATLTAPPAIIKLLFLIKKMILLLGIFSNTVAHLEGKSVSSHALKPFSNQ